MIHDSQKDAVAVIEEADQRIRIETNQLKVDDRTRD